MSEETQAAQDGAEENAVESSEIENTETENLEAQADTAPAPVETEKVDNVQRRINKITAEKHAEKREKVRLQAELDELRASQQQTTTQSEPKLEDFDYDEEKYTSALIDFKVSKKAESLQKLQQENVVKETQQQKQAAFNKKVDVYAVDHPDYFESIQSLPEFQADTFNAILNAENGVQLAHYLGKHLDVADEIASLDPISAAMRLGTLSAGLSAQGGKTRTSAAPDPIDPINTGGANIADEWGDIAQGVTFE